MKSIDVLEKLLQGIDPITKKKLDDDNLICSPIIVRALHEAIMLMQGHSSEKVSPASVQSFVAVPPVDNLFKLGESKTKSGFCYHWTDYLGKRHTIHAATLEKLRERENSLQRDLRDGLNIDTSIRTLNDMFERWRESKRGIKDNTFQNYQYMYMQFVYNTIGKKKLSLIVKSDLKRFFNSLVDEKGLTITTVDNIHNIIHQIFQLAVDDLLIRTNPADSVLKELKKTHDHSEPRRALTLQEQDLFLSYICKTEQYKHWYPIFAVMLGTGMRVGEAVGLRWCDISLSDGIIDINHTLIYYKHQINGCFANIHTPKTKGSKRRIPMLPKVKEAFQMELDYQRTNGISCTQTIDGYTDFIFINRFGDAQNHCTLNKAIKRITRDCNDEMLLKNPNTTSLLPDFSCHILRHTFATRMCEANISMKVVQTILGHSDITTTMDIYTDATRDFQRQEIS